MREQVSRPGSRFFEVWTGFASGVVGFLFGAWAFLYVGMFTGDADAGDQMGAGLGAAGVLGLVAAVAVPVAAFRGRHRRAARSLGLMIGWLVGMAILVNLWVVAYPVLADLSGTCPCEPLIEQLKVGAPFL